MGNTPSIRVRTPTRAKQNSLKNPSEGSSKGKWKRKLNYFRRKFSSKRPEAKKIQPNDRAINDRAIANLAIAEDSIMQTVETLDQDLRTLSTKDRTSTEASGSYESTPRITPQVTPQEMDVESDEDTTGRTIATGSAKCEEKIQNDVCSKATEDDDDDSLQVGLLPPILESHADRMTVILDMDETLLHSVFESVENNFRQDEERKNVTGRQPDFEFVMRVEANGRVREELVKVYKRPGLDAFLTWLSRHFEVVVFTAAIPEYAEPVLNRIDPQGRISHRLYRDSTVVFSGQPYVKDLSILGRALESTVLVDNNPMAMIACPDNAVPCQSYFENPHDRELEAIAKLLAEMNAAPDVRDYLRDRFRFRQVVNDHFHRLGRESPYDDDVPH